MEARASLPKEQIAINLTPLLSVVICTYNRSDRLILALEALETQTLSSGKFEVLVVDNRSTDDTATVCQQFQNRLANFQYVYESTQGLSKARNTGWIASQGTYIAYLDDDAIPCDAWVESILNVFETITPQPVGVGGPIYPLWEIPRPDWITPMMETLFTTLDGGENARWFDDNEYPWGANIVYRRDVLEAVGGFSEQLGRKGQNLLSGEEWLLNTALKAQGGRFYYSPTASVFHWVPKERINPEWLIRRSYWQGFSVALIDHNLGKSIHWQRLSSAWSLLKRLLELETLFGCFLCDSKFRAQISLWDRTKLILSWQWGYFSKVWFG